MAKPKGKRVRVRPESTEKLLAKLDEMVPLIANEVESGIEVEAALESANGLVTSPDGVSEVRGAECFNTIQRTMALHLALTLAKLFDEPSRQNNKTEAAIYKATDIVSIPTMVRALSQKRCRAALVRRCRTQWTPEIPSVAEFQETACTAAVDAVLLNWAVLRTDPVARNAIAKLKRFRNKMLAHMLLGEAAVEVPTYSELFILMDIGRDIANAAVFAVFGIDGDLTSYEEISVKTSTAFWSSALSKPSV